MQHLINIILLVAMFCSLPLRLAAEEQQIDYLSLAAKLVNDGNFPQAAESLAKVDEDQKKTAKFATVKGLFHLYQQQFSEAETAFRNAQALAPEDRYSSIYLGQALFGQQRFEEALRSFEAVRDLADEVPSIFIIRGRAYWQLDQKQTAWLVLESAKAKFPGEFRYYKLQFEWLAELKLYHQIVELAEQLSKTNLFPFDELTIAASVLRRHDQNMLAIALLERFNLRYPFTSSISLELAYSYAKTGRYLTAANLFAELSLLDERYAYEASELFRRAGQYQEALSYNSRVIDQSKKIKQKLATLVAMQDFELAVGVEEDLQRYGLLREQELRYALAYAFFKIGDFTKADEHLSYISQPDIFKKAIALRQEIARCETNIESCA